jgi:hypothetical protein
MKVIWGNFIPPCVLPLARMGEKRNAYRILVGKPEGKSYWENQDVGEWTILKWILEG